MLRTLTTVLLLLPLAAISQTQDSIGYVVLVSGERMVFHKPLKENKSDVWFYADRVVFYDHNGKNEQKQKNVAELHYGGRKFIKPPGSNLKLKNLQEVVLENERYLMTNYLWNDVNHIFIYDLSTNLAVEKKVAHAQLERVDRKVLDETIKKYFKDCPDGLAAMEKGLDESYKQKTFGAKVVRMGPPLFKYIANYTCDK